MATWKLPMGDCSWRELSQSFKVCPSSLSAGQVPEFATEQRWAQNLSVSDFQLQASHWRGLFPVHKSQCLDWAPHVYQECAGLTWLSWDCDVGWSEYHPVLARQHLSCLLQATLNGQSASPLYQVLILSVRSATTNTDLWQAHEKLRKIWKKSALAGSKHKEQRLFKNW